MKLNYYYSHRKYDKMVYVTVDFKSMKCRIITNESYADIKSAPTLNSLPNKTH